MPNQVWDAHIAELRILLDQILIEGEKYVIPDAVRDGFKSFAAGDDNNRKVVTFGALDAEKMIPLCRENIVPWWLPFTGKACTGDAVALDLLHDAFTRDVGKSAVPDCSSALTWLCHADKIASYPVSPTPDVLKRMVGWGGDVNSGDGKWLNFATKFMNAKALQALVDGGAAAPKNQRAVAERGVAKNARPLENFSDVLRGKTLHEKVDDDTLLSVKYVPEGGKLSQLRILFNFKAQRINEVFELSGGAAAMSNAAFGDYAPDALRIAEEKFIQLGGKPPYGLDKQRWPAARQLKPN